MATWVSGTSNTRDSRSVEARFAGLHSAHSVAVQVQQSWGPDLNLVDYAVWGVFTGSRLQDPDKGRGRNAKSCGRFWSASDWHYTCLVISSALRSVPLCVELIFTICFLCLQGIYGMCKCLWLYKNVHWLTTAGLSNFYNNYPQFGKDLRNNRSDVFLSLWVCFEKEIPATTGDIHPFPIGYATVASTCEVVPQPLQRRKILVPYKCAF